MSNLVKFELTFSTLTANQQKAAAALMTALTLGECAAIEQEEQTTFYDLAKPLSNEAKVKTEDVPKKTRVRKVADTLEQGARTDSEVDKYEASKAVKEEDPAILEGLLVIAGIVKKDTLDQCERELSLDDLRALVTPSILDNHRKALKDKIISLGGTKMADMPKSNYMAFADFIKDLK